MAEAILREIVDGALIHDNVGIDVEADRVVVRTTVTVDTMFDVTAEQAEYLRRLQAEKSAKADANEGS